MAWPLTYSVGMVGPNTQRPPLMKAEQVPSRPADELVNMRWLCLIALAAPVISVLTYFALRSAVS